MTFAVRRLERELDKLRRRLKPIIPRLLFSYRHSARNETEVTATLIYGDNHEHRYTSVWVLGHEVLDRVPIEVFRREALRYIGLVLEKAVSHE